MIKKHKIFNMLEDRLKKFKQYTCNIINYYRVVYGHNEEFKRNYLNQLRVNYINEFKLKHGIK